MPKTSQLADLALELARKLDSKGAMIVLPFIVAVVVVVQIAASPSPALWVVPMLLGIVEIAAVALHRLDRPAPAEGLSDQDTEAVLAALVSARNNVAARLQCDPGRCRANIFGENRLGRLQIINSLMVNMDRVTEWGISIPPGRGCTGIARATGQPKVLVSPFDGDDALEPDDATRVDPNLQWIISVPIKIDESVKWVTSVDGKDARSRTQVEGAVQDVLAVVPILRQFARKA
jgi:hypothetical protein